MWCRRAHSTCGIFTASTESDLRRHVVDLDLQRLKPRRPPAEDLVDGNGDGNTDRRQRTSPHAEGAARSPVGRRRHHLLEQPAEAANDDLWAARAYEGRTSGLKSATRRSATALGGPLTRKTTTAAQTPTPPGRQAPDGTPPATARSGRQQAHQNSEQETAARERAVQICST